MRAVASLWNRVRRAGVDGAGSLRAPLPSVALEVTPGEVVLVRLKRRRGRRVLESAQIRPFAEVASEASIARPTLAAPDELAGRVREVFEASGTRPGKVSLVLPDSLAKVTVLPLPERPTSRRQLGEMIRFKLRRAVPFRIEDAAVSYQLLPGEGEQASVLVAVMLRSLVEQYERLLEGVGARPGLVSLSSVSLFNLCRERISLATADGGDVALLNCAAGYFALLIVRGERLLFYRCKTRGLEDGADSWSEGTVARELAASFSYYREKLEGRGVSTVFVRSVTEPVDELATILGGLGVTAVEILDPGAFVTISPDAALDPPSVQKIAAAVGAAWGGR